ncbi:dTDP-4-dehydrorhamnose reductase [Dyella sp. 2HG41-7]|uniref:dTDP-4-dehydrorhamnose reductase n=1 Tax=Dyella sp. 2HG41-7 TaxID=2883239 RepID=UPI001F2B1DCD|nr:dTDP-4-dehydrorhamnose reductase [Dyella sp. 2HG41-7]
MNILLLGANGQLGRSFIEQGGLADLGNVTAASRDGARFDDGVAEVADLSAPATLQAVLDKVRPNVIINTAAYTAVDRAEQEESLATTVNGESVAAIACWAAANDALVVHFSTDYVFDGDATTPYAVDAATSPLGAYGRSKLAGEQALQASGAAYLLFRTAWVYAPHGHNFLRTMLRLGADRDELRVVADQYGAPTSTDIIVHATLAALTAWKNADASQCATLHGVHHLVASGHTSWHGFAQAIFEKAHARGLIARTPKVQAITTADYPTPAKRPTWSVLDNQGFQQRFGYALADWQQGLDHVIDTLAKQVR